MEEYKNSIKWNGCIEVSNMITRPFDKNEESAMLTTPIGKDLATSHWGAYDVVRQDGEVVGLAGRSDDPDPSR